jgi:mono/diheme cytochrome c family protein
VRVIRAGVIAAGLLVVSSPAVAQQAETATPESIKRGSALYAQHCAPCHGVRMKDPEGSFDLRKFPTDQHERFIRSVTKGKGAMPPWGGLFKPDEVESLWAYVVAGEKN